MSLEVKNLVKKYGEKTVVNDLSFKMEEPGVYALLGTNGAGKTTTIRIILGMLSYDSGEVLWNGKAIDPMSINLGYLAEERGLYPKFTLMDQLLYFAKLKKVPKNLAKERIKYWAEKLEVTEYLYQPVQPKKKAAFGKKKDKPKTADQLSKGNQQKIQLMAALLSDPEFIVLDEPLSGLDPVNTDLFKGIIMENITLGEISKIIAFLVAFIGGIGVLLMYIKKALKSLFKEELEPIKEQVAKNNELISTVDLNSTQNYLTKCFNDLRTRQQISETNIQRIYEQMEHYEKLGGNSYIAHKGEKLQKEGKL